VIIAWDIVMQPVEFIKDRIKAGRYTFTREEIASACRKDGAVLSSALAQLKRKNWIFPLSRGFYLALDVQHQGKGMLDPVWFVDDWAHYHKVEYYVAGLSAAALHGAAHQRPMQFQVFTDRQMRSIKHVKLHLALLFKKEITETMWEQRKSPAGYFRLATPEMTAYDIVAYHRSCPSLDHAATVLVELGEVLSADRLAGLIEQGCMLSVLQRVGWLLDYVGWREKTEELHAALGARQLSWIPLDTRLKGSGEQDRRWKIFVNMDIQPDIER
jgi:predicted transcriptional regulator of viral defense system